MQVNLRHEMHFDPIKGYHTDWAYVPYKDPDKLELRDYQVVGREWLRKAKRAFLTDWPGLGKGHRPTDNVLTPTGWQEVNTLEVGQQIIGSQGTPITVTGVYERGVLPMYRIIFSDGVDITVSEDHLWTYTRTYFFNGRVDRQFTHTTKVLQDRVNSGNRRDRIQIPLVKPVQFVANDLPIDAYTFGALLGDGTFRHSTPSISSADFDLLSNLQLNGDKLIHSSAYDYNIVGGNITAAIRKLGLHGTYSQEKYIPDMYKFASIDNRVALLQGLMDTDGYVADATQFVTTSKRLAEDVRFLVQSLGGVATCNFKDPTSSDGMPGLMAYILTLALPNDINPFRITRKANAHKPRTKYFPARYMNSIERVEDAECICISVDASDKLYVTEHCIVTHNTVQAAEAAETPALVVCPTYLTDQWYDFLKLQFPGKQIGLAQGTRTERTNTLLGKSRKFPKGRTWDWLVINVQMLRGYAIPEYFKTIIFDESHHLRNRKAMQSIGAAKLASDMSKNIYLLSATPMWKEVDDIWHQLHILQPKLFSSYHDFVRYFMVTDETPYGTKVLGVKKSMRKQLDELLSVCSFGRSYAQAGRVLPPTITTKLKVNFPKKFRESYDELKNYYSLQLTEDETQIFTNYMSVMHTLRNITAFPGKVEACANRIADNKKPAVVFAWYKDTAARIHKSVEDSVLVTGDYDPTERAKRAHRAQDNGQTIIATAPAMREGINLSRYRSVIFFEEDWPPGSNFQALSRVVRDRNDGGEDKDPVLLDYIHVKKTIDEVIHKVSQRRSGSIKQVMREILM